MSKNDDMAELQKIMESWDGWGDRASKGRRIANGSESGEPVKGEGPSEATGDFCQWQVYPNGSFSASTLTQKTLPPGVYSLDQDTNGRIYFAKTRPMTDKLLDLGETVTACVVKSIEVFWDSKQSFVDRGILFKRGILLWGPAGSGKTATVAFLIEKLIARGGIVILCQYPSLCIRALKVLRRIERERPLIVILEDIEEMVDRNGEHDLLSLLDGEHQVDNVVHLATTNYPELLGVRIINRPSRFDEVIKVPMPSEDARLRYFRHTLAGQTSDKDLERWARETDGLSIAHLRELLVATQCLGRAFDETLDRLKKMKVKPKSSEGTSHPGMV